MKRGLNNNQLKLIAMITMTMDHMGMMLFPEQLWLRIIGRLAFPIYAYMIAEGCTHTRSMGRYLGSLGIMALVCQIAYTFAVGSYVQSIFVTFSMSVALVWLIKWAGKRGLFPKILAGIGVFAAFFITHILPVLLPETDFRVEYDFIGVILPVAIWMCRRRWQKLTVCALLLALMSSYMWQGQWFGLLAVPVLALYDGSRGKLPLKWVFYFYYPAHLLLLEGIAWLTI